MVHDGDSRGAAGKVALSTGSVGTEEGGSHGGSGSTLDNTTAIGRERHGGRIRGSGAGEGEHGASLGHGGHSDGLLMC